jgi:FG-GAP-like repeat
MKNRFFSFAVFALLTFALAANSFAQCRAVNFETSSIGTVQNSMAYRTILDFNGDGKLDFAGDYDNGSSQINNVTVLENNGAGGFTPITLTLSNSSGGTFWGAGWHDFNADGRPDALAYFSTAPKMVIYYNNGDGTLTRGDALNFDSTSEYASGADDVNGDGRVDFITTGAPSAGTDEPNYYLYLSTGDGTYTARIHIIAEHANLFIADVNGDGKKDIAINKAVSNSNNYTLKYWMQSAGGGFSMTPDFPIGRFRIEGVDEFNGDGKDDFYGTTSFSTVVSFLISSANGTRTASDKAVNYGTARLYRGDFNGDGKRDVLASGGNGYTALFGNGAGAFRTFSNAFSFNDQDYNKVLNAVDFTGDGKTDLIKFTIDINTNRTNIELLKSTCASVGQTKTVDFDGDGKTDLAFWNPTSGKWSVKLSSQSADAAPLSTTFGNESFGDVPAVGDYDGDGKTDHAVFRPSTGDWYVLQSSTGALSVTHFGLDGDKPAASDFDGDGKTDIAVFRESEGNWYILSSQNGSIQALHFGASGDAPVQSDYDGDGKSDIAVYRASEGNWYYLKSSDNQFAVFHWGISTDKPVPADYDGDGRTDLAIFRASEGNWYVRRSASGTFSAARWGTNGDTPMPLDTDGDGIFEFGVYRPTENRWYISPSSSTLFGSANDVPVSIN